MSRKILLILCLVLAAVLLGASVLYNNLAGEIQAGGLATTPPETKAPENTPATQCPADDPVRTTEPETTEAAETIKATEATEAAEATEADFSAPDFTMLDWEEKEVCLTDFVGKPIILNFWASWCGPCKMEMPDLQEFYEKYGEEIHFLIVNCTDGSRETVESAKEFIGGEGYTFPVYFDTTSMGAYTYGASSIPLTFFIDAEGNLQAYYMGAMSAGILQQGIDRIYTPAETE